MNTHLPIKFRLDIQGLRAIAVLLVILAHAGIPWVSGGFVGVDIFFVLSGFLISGLLLQEYEKNGRLSLSAFYLRRLRRLFPALLVVSIVTVLVVDWLFSQADGRLILASLPFAISWTSNLFFIFKEQNYFNELGEKDIFLHTWSLGVEEQFYLLWPMLLLLALLIARKILSLKKILLIFIVLSFVISVIWSYVYPVSAFYMMPSRIWQFGLGCLVYVYSEHQTQSNISKYQSNIFLVLGLMMIFASAFFLNKQMTYPGYWSLLPSIGAAFVIFSGSTKKDSALILAHPILVWIGDRSYSLYLWHWPVIIVIGMLGIKEYGNYAYFGLAFLSTLLLSIVSYRFVELPFWKKNLASIPSKTFLLGSSAVFLLILAIGFHVQRIPVNVSKPQIDLATSIRSDLPVIYQMPCDAWYHHAKVEPCIFGKTDAPQTVVLLADSIGAQWFSAWSKIFAPPKWRFVVLTKSACAMVDEDYFYPRIGKVYDVCKQWREAVLTQIASFDPTVIIVGNAATYDFSPNQWVEGSKRVLDPLSKVAERVIVVAGTPVLGFDGPNCIARQLQSSHTIKSDDCVSDLSIEKFNHVAELLNQAANGLNNVQVLNPANFVCPENQCRALSQMGIPVFRDSQHLTDSFVISTEKQLSSQLPWITNY